jgi:valyl-tRNA synthetase
VPDPRLRDRLSEQAGEALIAIATAVRRFKSEHSLPLSTELAQLHIVSAEPALAQALQQAHADLASITRAQQIEVHNAPLDEDVNHIPVHKSIEIAITR